MKIASFALCCLSFMASSSAAYAGFDDSCVSPQEMSGVAANRAWVSEAVKSTCAPFEAKDLEKSPACVRQMSGYSLKTCSPLCASRHGQSGSGLYFRVSSEANGACMENRHNFVVGTHPSAIADAYRDRMLDEYKNNVRDRLKLTVSRLERLVTSPDSEGLMVGDRPLRDVFGETLNSARSFMEEMQGLMESDTLSAERLRLAHLHYNLLFMGCRTPIRPELDRCQDKFHLQSLDDMESGLRELEAAHPTTTIPGKLVFGVRSARKELMKVSDELGYAINELVSATKCRDLRNELANVEARGRLPVCGQASLCRASSPASALTKPVQLAVITIPTVIISGKFNEDERPTAAKAKDTDDVKTNATARRKAAGKKPTAAAKAQTEAELALAKKILAEAKSSEEVPKAEEEKPTHTPKTGNAEIDAAQEAIDRATDELKYSL